MIQYARILQTGLQSLLAVACGWACGRWQVVEAEPTVAYTNTLVLRFCIPCLQIWLLACKTDMRQADNWRALAVFLVWSVSLQALLAAHQLLSRGRLQLDRLGVDGLVLTTNNTGILGPVVLEAAVGARYAPLGMLATVVLYFQQLPLAQLLFQLHHQEQGKQQPRGQRAAAVQTAQQLKHATSPEPDQLDDVHASNGHAPQQQQQQQQQQPGAAAQHHPGSNLQQLHHVAHRQPRQQQALGGEPHPAAVAVGPSRGVQQHQEGHPQRGFGSAGSLPALHQQQHCHHHHHHHLLQQQQQPFSGLHHGADLEQQRQAGTTEQLGPAAAAAQCSQEVQPLLLQLQLQQPPPSHRGLPPDSAASYVVTLLLKNPLVWSTGGAVLLSALGSAALLDPGSAVAIKQLGFLEALLGWFAQTTAPLTLFTTGLWMFSNSQQQQRRQRQQPQPSWHAGATQLQPAAGPVGLCPAGDGACGDAADPAAPLGSSRGLRGAAAVPAAPAGFGSGDVAWRQLVHYLLLRATAAPALMVALCWLCGFQGDMAHALVILALLPVAQTAFVVCKQAEVGMAAVSGMLVASLLVMLPQLMVVLALLEGLGVFAGAAPTAAPAAAGDGGGIRP